MRTFIRSLVTAGVLLMLGNSVAAAEDPLMATINKLYGVPYKTAGTTPNGFDCSGFTSYVFAQLGVQLPHSSASQYQVGQAVARQDLQPGDLVFFNTSGHGVSHVGIYIGDNLFVHSESGVGVVKTRLDDPYYWSKRYVGAKRLSLPLVDEAKQAEAEAAAQMALSEQAVQNPQETPYDAAGQEQQVAGQHEERDGSTQPDKLPLE